MPPINLYAANYKNVATWDGVIGGNVTTVGTNGGPSYYGTYDQSGNVSEYNDLDNTHNIFRGLRGGSWINTSNRDIASTSRAIVSTSTHTHNIGFRIATPLSILVLNNPNYFATVENNGNTSDPVSVPYTYQIGKFTVTNTEYAEFLNAVAKSEQYRGLYHIGMNGSIGGITRSGINGAFTYSVKTNYGNKPVNFVSWLDCARYCNWLSNDKPSGFQTSTTTENGAYNLNGATTGNAVAVNTINPSTGFTPSYRLPTENEWYKAAYYSPNYGGSGVGGYYLYATQSNTTPQTAISANSSGDGPYPPPL